jgi:hypothetical protein
MNEESRDTRFNRPALEMAVDVVENRLGIKGFIKDYKEKLFSQLEDNYRHVRQQPQASSRFLDDSIPLIGGLIQLGTTVHHLRHATVWAATTRAETDPVSTLSNLTFLYLIETGWGEVCESGEHERMAIWREMREAMQGLFASEPTLTTCLRDEV